MERSFTEATLLRLVGDGLALCYRGAAGYEVRLTPDAALVLTGEAYADLNYAVIAAGPAPEDRFREFSQVIQARSAPLLLAVSAAVNDRLAPLAQQDGLQSVGLVPLMTCTAARLVPEPSPYQSTRVETLEELRIASRLIAQANALPDEAVQRACGEPVLDAPGFDLFLAWDRQVPVSTVQTTRFGTTVGIWAMATAPAHQRRGVGRSLLTQVMAYHQARGASLFYLVATAAGYPLYMQAGFQTAVEVPTWVAGHSTQMH